MNPTLILLGKVAGTAALATGALVTGVSATHSAAADSPTTTSKKVHCGAGLGKADPKLKAALEAARKKPAGTERHKALREVAKDAAKGEYGDRAQVRALRMRIGRLHYRAQAPDALKSALKAARSKPAGDERKAALEQVRKDAVAGTYGSGVEKIATKRQQHRETCQAQRSQS